MLSLVLGGGTALAQAEERRVNCCLRGGDCRVLSEAQCDARQASDVDPDLAETTATAGAMCSESTVCGGGSAVDSAPPTRTRPGAELVYVSECGDPEIDERGYWVQRCLYHPVRDCQLLVEDARQGSWPLNAWELGVDVPWAAAPSVDSLFVVVSGYGYFAGEEVSACEGF